MKYVALVFLMFFLGCAARDPKAEWKARKYQMECIRVDDSNVRSFFYRCENLETTCYMHDRGISCDFGGKRR